MQCGSKSQMRVLLSARNEIVSYVYLQHHRFDVDFLMCRESHHLPRINFNCVKGLFVFAVAWIFYIKGA